MTATPHRPPGLTIVPTRTARIVRARRGASARTSFAVRASGILATGAPPPCRLGGESAGLARFVGFRYLRGNLASRACTGGRDAPSIDQQRVDDEL